MAVELGAGWATGVGSLPHLDPLAAAELVLELLPDLPAVPSLPRRSAAEAPVAQALVGVRGVQVHPDGTIEVDAHRVDPAARIVPDLDHDAFVGLRVFLAAARGRVGPVKWQFVGPITLGIELMRRGVVASAAFDVAVRAVRVYGRAIHRAVAEALPDAPQVAFIDEPGLSTILCPGFPLPADTAIDIVSGALAVLEPAVVSGLHCCGRGDWAAVLAAGPAVLSLPVRADVVPAAGYLARFLEGGGWIAWGAVPSDGPVGDSAERYWRELSDLWCELAQGGCDPTRLSRQALVTPACGLAGHDEQQARRTLGLVVDVAARVASRAGALHVSLGA